MKSSVFELHSGLASVPLRFTWSPFYGFTKIPECTRNTGRGSVWSAGASRLCKNTKDHTAT